MSRTKNTYWVEYSFTYDWTDPTDGEVIPMDDASGERFTCLKKDIEKEVEKRIKEDFDGTEKNLKIKIIDTYLTTEYEV